MGGASPRQLPDPVGAIMAEELGLPLDEVVAHSLVIKGQAKQGERPTYTARWEQVRTVDHDVVSRVMDRAREQRAALQMTHFDGETTIR